jgi:hypothetical protein
MPVHTLEGTPHFSSGRVLKFNPTLNRLLGTAIVMNTFRSAGGDIDSPEFYPWSNSTFFGCTPNKPKQSGQTNN